MRSMHLQPGSAENISPSIHLCSEGGVSQVRWFNISILPSETVLEGKLQALLENSRNLMKTLIIRCFVKYIWICIVTFLQNSRQNRNNSFFLTPTHRGLIFSLKDGGVWLLRYSKWFSWCLWFWFSGASVVISYHIWARIQSIVSLQLLKLFHLEW